jgi:hypothetical protein
MTPTADQSELLWQAFQYVSGELAAADSRAFEARLEHDSAACDALAEAMLLCESVAAAEWEARRDVIPHALATARPSRRFVAASLAAAAALLLMVWLGGGFPGPAPVVDSPPMLSAEVAPSRSMLSVWVSLKEYEAAVPEDAHLDGLRDEVAEATAEVPDWMFAALVSSATVHEMNELLPGVPSLPEEPL